MSEQQASYKCHVHAFLNAEYIEQRVLIRRIDFLLNTRVRQWL